MLADSLRPQTLWMAVFSVLFLALLIILTGCGVIQWRMWCCPIDARRGRKRPVLVARPFTWALGSTPTATSVKSSSRCRLPACRQAARDTAAHLNTFVRTL